MRGIIGIDIDGVITDEGDGNENIWVVEMEKWFGRIEKVVDAYEFDIAYGLPREAVVEFFQNRAASIFENVKVRPGCREVLRALRQSGIRVVLITARDPEFAEVSKTWLAKHDIPHDDLIFDTDKGKVCRELGVELLIDDHVKNCEEVIDVGVPSLCFTMEHNARLETRAKRIESWDEIGRYLAEFFEEESLAV